jgi:hypothetical protein
MPQILVTTNPPGGGDEVVLLRERIGLPDLESDHFSARLIERLGWALVDADELERPTEIPGPRDPSRAPAPAEGDPRPESA